MKKIFSVLLLGIIIAGSIIYSKNRHEKIVEIDNAGSTEQKILEYTSYYSPTAVLTMRYPGNYTGFGGRSTGASVYENEGEVLSIAHYPRALDQELAEINDHAGYANTVAQKSEAIVGGQQAYKVTYEGVNGASDKLGYFVNYIIPDGKYLYVFDYFCVKKNKECPPAFEKMIGTIKFGNSPAPLDTQAYSEKALQERKSAKVNHAINRDIGSALHSFKLEMLANASYANVCGNIQMYVRNKVEGYLREYGEPADGIEAYSSTISKIACKSTAGKFVISVPVTLETGADAALCADSSEPSTSKISTDIGQADYTTLSCR